MKLKDWLQIKIFGINIWPIIKWFRRDKKTKYRFGKLTAKHDPKDRTLKMAKYLVDVPEPPTSFSNFDVMCQNLKADVPTLLPMDGNDTKGDCGVAGFAHIKTLQYGRISQSVVMSLCDVLKIYKKVSPRDQGVVLLDFLKWLRNKGYIIAFARIDPKDIKTIKQCIWLFGGVYLGFNVQQDAIFDFDAVPKIVWQPEKQGVVDQDGHCVVEGEYTDTQLGISTWGDKQPASLAWHLAQVDEAFVVITDAVKQAGFAQGFNYDQLLADLQAVTINN